MFRTSVDGFFFPNCQALIKWFELARVKSQYIIIIIIIIILIIINSVSDGKMRA